MLRVISRENIPTWALPYLINGDASGLWDDEVKMIDEWIENFPHVGFIDFECADENEFFSAFPAFGKPTTCEECLVFDDSLLVGEYAKRALRDILHSDDGSGEYTAHYGMAGYFKRIAPDGSEFYTAFDNSTGDCLVEDMTSENAAIDFVSFR